MLFDHNSEGEENPLFARFWDFLPRKVGEVSSDLRINIADLLPRMSLLTPLHYYAFNGSLTTPPCSEGGEVVQITEPVQASRAQMDKFMSILLAGPTERLGLYSL